MIIYSNLTDAIFIRTTHRTFPTLLIVQHRSEKKKLNGKKLSVHSEEIKNERHPQNKGKNLICIRWYVCLCV